LALPYRPFERRTLENLLSASQSGLSPDLGYSIFDDIQQSALDRLAQQRGVRMDRRAVRQDALSGLGQQLTDAALGGVPAEGLEALASLQSTANPMIPQGGLDALVGQAGTLAGSVPTAGANVEPLSAEDIAGIETDVQSWATGAVPSPDGNPMNLYDAMRNIVGQLRMQGYPEDVLEQVRQFVEQKWLEYGGPPRGSQAQGPPAAAPAPGVPGQPVAASAPSNPYGLPTARDPGAIYGTQGGGTRSLLDLLGGAFGGGGSTPPLYGPAAPTRGDPWRGYSR
jgi:hypothetical protein